LGITIHELKSRTIQLPLMQLCLKAKRSSLYSNAFYLMFSTAGTSILGFVFWNIMARCFSRSDVGIGSALNAASGLVSSIATLGLGIGLVRFVPEVKDRAASLINSAFTLAGIASAAGALIYLLGLQHFAPALGFLRTNFWLACFFVLLTIGATVAGLVDQSLIAARTSGFVFWKNLTASLLKLPLPVLVFASLKGYGIFAGGGAAVLAALMLALFLFLPRAYDGFIPRPQWDGGLLKRVLPFSFCNYLSGLLNSMPGYIYPLMVLNILGPEQNAYFTMAWMIAMVLTIIPGSLAQSLFAEGSHNPGRLGGDGRRSLLISLLLTLPAVGVISLLGGWLLHCFGPAYARHSTGLLHILVLSIIPVCINSFFMTINQVKKHVPLIILQSAFLAVTSLALGYWLLGKTGLEGIGAAYLLAQSLLAVIVFRPIWRELRGRKSETSM
jgi:O-antigen/teichoic acid export membrane protein